MYVDSNVFILASLDEGRIGADCSEILQRIADHRILCASSYLVLDEVLYILRKNVPKEDALNVVKAIMSIPIRWIDVDRAIILGMLETVEKIDLRPRDAIHLSSMRSHGIDTIISDDTDFDGIEGIKKLFSTDVINEDK